MTFLVWNPAKGLPTVTHHTLESARREAERLWRQTGETFYVMAPLIEASAMREAVAFNRGKKEGERDAHRQIMLAEGNADRWSEQARDLKRQLDRAELWLSRGRRFQAIVADAVLWFDGFAAAYELLGKKLPRIPDRPQLRELNAALQDLKPSDYYADLDDEIPF